LLADIEVLSPTITVFSSNSTYVDFGDSYELYGDVPAYIESGLALTIINDASWNTVEALLLKANGTPTASVTPCEPSVSFFSPDFFFYIFTLAESSWHLEALRRLSPFSGLPGSHHLHLCKYSLWAITPPDCCAT